jgi:hypothetical protein
MGQQPQSILQPVHCQVLRLLGPRAQKGDYFHANCANARFMIVLLLILFASNFLTAHLSSCAYIAATSVKDLGLT